MSSHPTAPRLHDLGLTGDRPLVLVDVDEVLALFTEGFATFLDERGYQFRIDRFALFQNIYRPGEDRHLELDRGKALFDEFFATRCDRIAPAPGALAALGRLSSAAEIVILSNAPAEAERLRAGWLKAHGLRHPLILNTGPKGPIAAELTAQTSHPTAFVDDLLQNLDSVADHSPATATFQHVADLRLRPLAPTSPRHPRIDDWSELAEAILTAIRS